MTAWLQQFSKKYLFQKISHLNALNLEKKFYLDVNLGSSFE